MADINPYFSFSGWGYGEDSSIVPKNLANSLTIDSDGNLLADGKTIGSVAAGSVLDGMEVDGDKLIISYHTEDNSETQTVEVDLSKFVDVYKGGGGITVDGYTISINDEEVATQTELDTETQTRTDADAALQEQITVLEDKIPTDYVKDVELTTTDNNVYTLMVDGETKGGFTLPNTEGLATEEEVSSLTTKVEDYSGQVAALQEMVDILSAQVEALSKTNVVPVNLSNLTGDLTDTSADYVLSGTLSSTATITGKSITLDDTVVVSDDNRLNLKANDVTINGSTISGEYVKANGNSVIKIDECENVVIQGLTFDDTYSGYNGVEISLTQGGTVYPKNILIDGCEIGGTFSNNALNVYATADNATVTVSNCHFVDVSNCLRISNTTKATGVTFNVVNCTVDQWEHKENNEAYYGFFLGQDYTSSSDEEAVANNLFGQDKITLNFTDLIHAGEKVCPSDPYSVCGVDDGTQVVYTYADKHGKWYAADNKEMYPIVTFA